MSWTLIITTVSSTVFSSGVLIAYLKLRNNIQLKKMELSEVRRLEDRGDIDDLKVKFDSLYGKYLEVLTENKLHQVELEILKKRIQQFRGYKSQAILITRLTKGLNAYHKNKDLKALLEVLDKNLLR